jgi:ABC-type branched-subunit amino acid transport system substrate-binding protein
MTEIRSYGLAGLLKILAVACLFVPASLPAQLTRAQAAGKQIYMEGHSPSGAKVEAILGEGSTRVPARLMLCASCHGGDGKGRPEGGVTPSEITWEKLAKPLRAGGQMRRDRPGYTLATLQRAIAHGVDSAGHSLGATMPHYRISLRDLNNLIEYLRILGNEPAPGVTDTAIRLGTIVPATGPLANSGRSSVALLRAYIEELNSQGGIYGRRLELQVLPVSGGADEMERQARDFIREQNVFAVLGVLAPGTESRLAALTERMGVPTITPVASGLENDGAGLMKSFYLLSGLPPQVRVLVKFAHRRFSENAPKAAIVYPVDMAELAGLVTDQWQALSGAEAVHIQYSHFEGRLLSAELSRQKIEIVFFLGPGKELQETLAGASGPDWRPTVFQPGPLAGEDVLQIPATFPGRVFLSFPTLPSDFDPQAIGEYRALLATHKLSMSQPAFSLTMLASAKVLLEGLRVSGRQLDREKFIKTLSSLYGFNTGLSPPVTYGTTRRIGALGAYIVEVDLKNKTLAPVDAWMAP